MQELDKILEEIDKATDEYGMVDYINDEPVISKPQAKNIIRKHMSGKDTDVPTNDGWISVDDRLPEVGEYVLGTTKLGEVLIFRYGWNCPHSKKMFFRLCGAAADITAWRPLPEPYRPEQTKESETH